MTFLFLLEEVEYGEGLLLQTAQPEFDFHSLPWEAKLVGEKYQPVIVPTCQYWR